MNFREAYFAWFNCEEHIVYLLLLITVIIRTWLLFRHLKVATYGLIMNMHIIWTYVIKFA